MRRNSLYYIVFGSKQISEQHTKTLESSEHEAMKQIKQFAAHNFQARSSLHNNMTCDLESHAIAIKRFGV